jgi:hypothetical protein
LELLAKLFCTQECYARNNKNDNACKGFARAKQSSTLREEISDTDESYLSDLSEWSEDEDDYVAPDEDHFDDTPRERANFGGIVTPKAQGSQQPAKATASRSGTPR